MFWVTLGSNTNLHLTLIYLFSVVALDASLKHRHSTGRSIPIIGRNVNQDNINADWIHKCYWSQIQIRRGIFGYLYNAQLSMTLLNLSTTLNLAINAYDHGRC